MKVTRTIPVTSDEFYDCIENEVMQHTQSKKIHSGLTYNIFNKKSGINTTIHIIEYTRHQCYSFTFSSLSENIIISYHTEETEDGLKIKMEQIIDGYETKKMNKIFKWFSDGVYLGRMTDTIFEMQKKIEKQRKVV